MNNDVSTVSFQLNPVTLGNNLENVYDSKVIHHLMVVMNVGLNQREMFIWTSRTYDSITNWGRSADDELKSDERTEVRCADLFSRDSAGTVSAG